MYLTSCLLDSTKYMLVEVVNTVVLKEKYISRESKIPFHFDVRDLVWLQCEIYLRENTINVKLFVSTQKKLK